MKIKIMSIQDLLHIPNLKNCFNIMVVFITTKTNYYDFGYTEFYLLNIADTNAPLISDLDLKRLHLITRWNSHINTYYVCCDAGLSRSPAIALYIAHKRSMSSISEEILHKYKFLNEHLFYKLVECQNDIITRNI